MAAIRVVGVRGDPCGAMRPTHCTLDTDRHLMVIRHVSILRDHPQGVCLYLAKVTELFKSF